MAFPPNRSVREVAMMVNRSLFIILGILVIVACLVWLWYWRVQLSAYSPVNVPQPEGVMVEPVQKAPIGGGSGSSTAQPQGL